MCSLGSEVCMLEKCMSEPSLPVSEKPLDYSPELVTAASDAAKRIMKHEGVTSDSWNNDEDDDDDAENTENKMPNILRETVSRFKELTTDAVSGIKELAEAAPRTEGGGKKNRLSFPQSCSNISNTMDDVKTWYGNVRPFPPSRQPGPSSPERAVRSLYGEQSNFETVGNYTDDQPPPATEHKKDVKGSKFSISNLMSPFLACSSGLAEHVPHATESTVSRVKRAMASVMSPEQELERRTESWGASTFDSQAEEERLQIQRLTSWGTMASTTTVGTYATYATDMTAGTMQTADGGGGEIPNGTVLLPKDDDGNAIDPVLMTKVEKRRVKRKKPRRKRTVKFDYPPIRSVRECERYNQEDLPNLFFTEQELDQIEDDRSNTRIADDVEIVAVTSPMSEDGGSYEENDHQVKLNGSPSIEPSSTAESSKSSRSPLGSSAASFSKYLSTPRILRMKNRKKSPPPPLTLTGSSESSSVKSEQRQKGNTERDPPENFFRKKKSPATPRNSDAKAGNNNTKPPKRDPQLVKGVQLFVRERSTTC